MSKNLIVVPVEAHNCLRWLAGALQAVADEGDLITMDGERRTIGSILDDADRILGLITTQPAAGEPVAPKACATLKVTRDLRERYIVSVKRFDAELLQEGRLIDVYAAPPAAAHGDEAVRKDAERYRWVREPSSGNKVWAMITDGECGRNMDAAIDAAMRAQGDGD